MLEYRDIVLYIVDNKLNNDNITEPEKEKMKRMAPTYMGIFGEEVCDIFLKDALEIPYYADYFGVDLENITQAKPIWIWRSGVISQYRIIHLFSFFDSWWQQQMQIKRQVFYKQNEI